MRKVIEQNGTKAEERIYLGGAFEVYRKYNGSGSATLERETLHIMDDKQRIALVETRTIDIQNTDRAPRQLIRYQFGNHLSSAMLELDDQAQIITYEEYYPYGSTSYQAVRSQTETPKRYRYTGKERDEETGLYYYGARYYAPWLGRWTSPDPAEMVEGPNLFQYVWSNPVVFYDPKGTDTSLPSAVDSPTDNRNRLLPSAAEFSRMSVSERKDLAKSVGWDAIRTAYHLPRVPTDSIMNQAIEKTAAVAKLTPKMLAATFLLGFVAGGLAALAGPTILTALGSKPVTIGTTFLAYEGIANAPSSTSQTYKSQTTGDLLKTTATIFVSAIVLSKLFGWLFGKPKLKMPSDDGGGGGISSGSPRSPSQIKSEVFGKRLEGTPRERAEQILEQIKAGTYKPPSDLTKEHLLEYKKTIEDALKQGRPIDKSGVQEKRLEIIDQLLQKHFKK